MQKADEEIFLGQERAEIANEINGYPEQELYKVYLRILDSKASRMTRHELLLGYSKWKSHHVVEQRLYKTDLCKSLPLD